MYYNILLKTIQEIKNKTPIIIDVLFLIKDDNYTILFLLEIVIVFFSNPLATHGSISLK